MQRLSSTNRETVLRRALAEYEKYLTRLDDYGLLSARDRKLFAQYSQNPAQFSLASKSDAANRRDVKVARFREEKELKQKLEVCPALSLSLSFYFYFLFPRADILSTSPKTKTVSKATTKPQDNYT